jgi:hypothetical protein
MKIKLTRELKAALLKAIQEGELNFDIFPDMKGKSLEHMVPDARTLTKEEATQLWENLEKEY